MDNAMMTTLIGAGIAAAIGYGWLAHFQNRHRRRARAAAGGDGGSDSYAGTSDGSSWVNWFSGDTSGSSSDGDNCSSSDSGSSGGDCGGGGDGGGGD